jgi:hypothetical protein
MCGYGEYELRRLSTKKEFSKSIGDVGADDEKLLIPHLDALIPAE